MKYAHVLTAIVAGSLMACSGTGPGWVFRGDVLRRHPWRRCRRPAVGRCRGARFGRSRPDLDQRIARFKPVSMTFDASSADRPGTPDGRPARHRLPVSREHVLATERSGGARPLQGAREGRHARGTEPPSLPADQWQPMGSGRREPSIRRHHTDAAGPLRSTPPT